MDWTKLLEFLGVFGLSATSFTFLVAFLGRKYIEFVSNKKLNETKQSLINETEELRHELSKKANDYQVKLNGLHAERLEVIKNFYGLLTLFNDKLYILVIAGHGDEREVEEAKKLYSDYYELRTYYKKNKILLDVELSDLINELVTKLHSALFSFNRIIETTVNNSEENIPRRQYYNEQSKREYWDKAADLVEKETPLLLEKLENEFRLILGVKL